MEQPPAVPFNAFADAWTRAIETEISAALCAIGAGQDFDYGKVCNNFNKLQKFNSKLNS